MYPLLQSVQWRESAIGVPLTQPQPVPRAPLAKLKPQHRPKRFPKPIQGGKQLSSSGCGCTGQVGSFGYQKCPRKAKSLDCRQIYGSVSGVSVCVPTCQLVQPASQPAIDLSIWRSIDRCGVSSEPYLRWRFNFSGLAGVPPTATTYEALAPAPGFSSIYMD